MYASAFVLGFHGCDESVGEKILRGEDHLRGRANDYDWLGHGTYFWENSPTRARHWAEFIRDHPQWFETRIEKPFVSGAIIDLGLCLDLTEAESLEIVREGFENLKLVFTTAGVSLPENERGSRHDRDYVKRKLDCAVINHVHALRENDQELSYDSVRGAFFEGEPLYEGAAIMARTHIQVCVRNTKHIRGYFRPISEATI
jgi:hypothetical protein